MTRLYEIDVENFEILKTFIIGLLVECPMGGNPKKCQLYLIRKKPLKDRLVWLDTLSHAEMKDAFHKHRACLKKLEE